jgi:hypothetical protein
MRRIYCLFAATLIGGCSTAIKYSVWDGKPVQSTGLRFSLQDSAITLSSSLNGVSEVPGQGPAPAEQDAAPPKPDEMHANAGPASPAPKSKPVTPGKPKPPATKPKAPAEGAKPPPADKPETPEAGVKQQTPKVQKPPIATSGKTTANCPKNVTEANWWTCFNQVSASVSIAALDAASKPVIYVATPHDISHLNFSTTSISGTAIAGQDTLYSQVTIKYTNNAGTIVAAAGSAAVTGFGIAGPIGGVAGAIVGAGGAIGGGAAHGANRPAPNPVAGYICAGEAVDLTASSMATMAPAIYFPMTIKGASGRPFAGSLDADSPTTTPSACWHELPNVQALGEAVPVVIGAPTVTSSQREPRSGDGWLFRFVSMDDLTKLPAGAESMSDFLASKDSSQQFPYTLCRKVVIQVTWWKELAEAIAATKGSGDPMPRIVQYNGTMSDPNYVSIAAVKKGGAINFRADCGATVSTTVDSSNVAAISTAVTNTENIYKAEQTWESGQAKK